jgi:alpha-mannosidase
MTHYTFKLRLIAYKTFKRIDFEPSIIGWDGATLRELRIFFPINSTMHDVAYDVPFAISKVGISEINPSQYGWGSMHQPREVQNFMYAGGTGFGVTISTSVAPVDYIDPTLPPAANTIIQPLLLATRLGCSKGAVWAQKGDHSYRFSLFSHTQGCENGWRLGVQANNPLLAVAPGTKDSLANLPESASFCSVAQDNILVPVIKKSEDNNTSAVLRFYDYAGKTTSPAQIRFMANITAAEKTNMIEENGQTVKSGGNVLSITVGAYSIETARIILNYNSLALVGLKR